MERSRKLLVLPVCLWALVLSGCNGEVGAEVTETRHPDGTKTIEIKAYGKIEFLTNPSEAIELVVQDEIDDIEDELGLQYIQAGTPTVNGLVATVPFTGSGPSYMIKPEIDALKRRAQNAGFDIDMQYSYTDLMIHTEEQ